MNSWHERHMPHCLVIVTVTIINVKILVYVILTQFNPKMFNFWRARYLLSTGILRMYRDILVRLDFIHLAQFLTRLPDNISGTELFDNIAQIRMVIEKQRFTQVLATQSVANVDRRSSWAYWEKHSSEFTMLAVILVPDLSAPSTLAVLNNAICWSPLLCRSEWASDARCDRGSEWYLMCLLQRKLLNSTSASQSLRKLTKFLCGVPAPAKQTIFWSFCPKKTFGWFAGVILGMLVSFTIQCHWRNQRFIS